MNTAPDSMNTAKAIALYLEYLDKNPPEFELLTSTDQCAACGQQLKENGATTTKHAILECCNCGQGYVRDEYTLELKPIYGFDGF